MELTEKMIKAGDIWQRPGSPTIEWLRAMRAGDPLLTSDLLIDGARPDYGAYFPDILLGDNGQLTSWPGKDVRVVRRGVIIQEIEAVARAASVDDLFAEVEREGSDEAIDKILGNWLPFSIVALFLFAFVVGLVG
jgi:hypothetical protein